VANCPATHAKHVVDPVVLAYWPAAQLEQAADPLPEYKPARQFTHEVETEAPDAGDDVPAPQLEHVPAMEAPTAVEYNPAVQLVQTDAPMPL